MSRTKTLIWAPAVLFPVSNLIISALTGVDHDVNPMWLLGAAAEELLFRFLLLKTLLLPRVKPRLAIIIVSILFAGMHLFNLRAGQPLDQTLPQMACAFAFAVWAGAVTWKSTWLIPLAAHVLINATATDNGTWIYMLVSTIALIDGVLLIKTDTKQS